MSGLGLDPGSAKAAIRQCLMDGERESISAKTDASQGVLPSAVLRDDAYAPTLETEAPLLPFGVGGPWPPEARVGSLIGARRMPLALAMAALERDRTLPRTPQPVESGKWTWTSVAHVYEQNSKHELLSTLVRRTADAVALSRSAPIAIAVANELPLLEQTAIVGRLGGLVRLVWRCMAAGLARSFADATPRAPLGRQPLADGMDVLHVHVGTDGFEATRFKYLRSRGKYGPLLMVPARSRPSEHNTRSRPFLGLQLCAHAHWARLGDDDAVWSAMFGSRDPLGCPSQSVQRLRTSSLPSSDVRAGWARALQGSTWSEERALREIDTWVVNVESLIATAPGGPPALVLLTGDYAQLQVSDSSSQVLTAPLRRLRKLCDRMKVACEVLGPDGLSSGAAIFASRRARGWATFLDELPSVEIVVQTPAGPAWKKLLEAKHYDAGAPVVVTLDHFSLNAGEKHVELPVYVDEFGPDTPHVLRTRVDFRQATSKQTSAEVVVEVEAATGLPVVRAAIHGEVDETAEVDWANDHEKAFTGLRKAEYLDRLPRTFPPIQERFSALWWVQGGKYKTVKLPMSDGREYTGEALGERLVTLFPGVEPRFAAALKGFNRLAAKKEWNPAIGKWIAPTDLEGRNSNSKTLDAASEILFKAVFRKWNDPKLSNTAGRALASLCWRDQKWVEHLMLQCPHVEDLKELHYVIAGLGACTHREEDMARAIHAFAQRLHEKVHVAKATYKQPVGIHTLRAMGNLLAHRPDALKLVRDKVATQLAEDITEFIELTLEHGKFMQKFQAALRALVYMTRRRSYQDGFLPVDSTAFRRAVSCCAKVYIATRLAAEATRWAPNKTKLIEGYKEDLKALRLPGGKSGAGAHEATCRVIDGVDMSRIKLEDTQFPTSPEKLLALLVQVVEYIEGRGTGILVMGDEDEDDDDGDGG